MEFSSCILDIVILENLRNKSEVTALISSDRISCKRDSHLDSLVQALKSVIFFENYEEIQIFTIND